MGYSNDIPMDWPPWKKSWVPRGFEFPKYPLEWYELPAAAVHATLELTGLHTLVM